MVQDTLTGARLSLRIPANESVQDSRSTLLTRCIAVLPAHFFLSCTILPENGSPALPFASGKRHGSPGAAHLVPSAQASYR
jgi:hypothetical protein